jgi:CubicO group peptidase (beta-lactamase class C family)
VAGGEAASTVDGFVAPGFEPVREEFVANFSERGERGASVCVYVEGRPVVDLWGGWPRDAIVLVYSATKGVTAVCTALLCERGMLDPDALVRAYWPEFRAGATVGQALSHQAGLPLVEGDLTLEEVLAWDPVVERLARQEPLWPPGTRHGYHMRTFGWIAGELVRRVTGRTVGAFLRDEVAARLDLDFWIGLPEALERRVQPVVPPKDDLRAALAPFGDSMLLARVFSNPGGLFNYDEMWNRRELRACELPSSNGVGDARALARLYAALVGEVDGVRLLRPETVARVTEERVRGRDEVIMVETAYGLGFMLGSTFGAANPPHVFGHAGAGGSLAFADPVRQVGFGYVMSDLRFDARGDPRSERLVAAVYRAIG